MKANFDENNLKLIYVLKVGYNHKDEGSYEFIFSNDETSIDIEGWCWDMIPACDHALPPSEDYISEVFNLKTSTFDLFCLHEAVDRAYMHGYHTIHALAYEIERENSDVDGYSQFEKLIETTDDVPLIVFHYGMTLARVKEILYARKIILKNNEFIESSSVSFD
jgi:hypothetical protein